MPLSLYVRSPAAVTAPPSNQIEQLDKPFYSLCVLLQKIAICVTTTSPLPIRSFLSLISRAASRRNYDCHAESAQETERQCCKQRREEGRKRELAFYGTKDKKILRYVSRLNIVRCATIDSADGEKIKQRKQHD